MEGAQLWNQVKMKVWKNVKLTFGQPFFALTHQEQNPADQNQRKEPNHDLVREPGTVN